METSKTIEIKGLSNQETEMLIKALQAHERIEKVVLFGSRALGTQRKGSDIDLALWGKNLGLSDILNISLDIDDLFLPYKIDLLVFDNIKEPALKEHINNFGVVLLQRG